MVNVIQQTHNTETQSAKESKSTYLKPRIAKLMLWHAQYAIYLIFNMHYICINYVFHCSNLILAE